MTPERNHIYQGDVLDVLRDWPDECVHMVVTSPPYWNLRDYLVEGQLGLEPRLDCLGWATGDRCGECYVCHMVAVFREVRRVLRKDGTLWLNLGSMYTPQSIHLSRGPRGGLNPRARALRDNLRTPAFGKPKDVCMMPSRVALALQADGWWVRSAIVWAKGLSFCKAYAGSVMPESVTDRPTSAHEMLYLLTKSARYFYDNEAVKEEATYDGQRGMHGWSQVPGGGDNGGLSHGKFQRRNLRDVWAINPYPYREAHFATYPPALVRPCIMAGTSEKGVCPKCGAPWARVVEKVAEMQGAGRKHIAGGDRTVAGNGWEGVPRARISSMTLGWRPSCACDAGDPQPALVLDPFMGAGTTAVVAQALGRDYVGIELNADYVRMAERRVAKAAGRPIEMTDDEAARAMPLWFQGGRADAE